MPQPDRSRPATSATLAGMGAFRITPPLPRALMDDDALSLLPLLPTHSTPGQGA